MGISGKYVLVSSENMDEYLKAVGVSDEVRKLIPSVKPELEVTENGNNYLFKTITPDRTIDISFEDGKEFTENIPDGRTAQSTITRNGDVFTHVQKVGGLTATTTRTFTQDTLTSVSQAAGVTSTRVYKRIQFFAGVITHRAL